MKGRIQLFVLFLLTLFYLSSHATTDSSESRKKVHLPSTLTYCNNFSASYTNYKNWKYGGYSNYSFLLRTALNYDTVGEHWENHTYINAELGYTKFADSAWYKSTDLLTVHTELIKNKGKQIENYFSFHFDSQFLSAYETSYNSNGSSGKKWINGFGNPMSIDLGYGAVLHFWKNSRISLAFATLRTSTAPVQYLNTLSDKDIIYKNAIITSEYGMSIQVFIRKNFGSHLRWENNSRFFTNAINRSRLDLDFKNRLIVKIFRYMDFIIDTRIRYMPYPPYKFQFRNEFMISFTLEKF